MVTGKIFRVRCKSPDGYDLVVARNGFWKRIGMITWLVPGRVATAAVAESGEVRRFRGLREAHRWLVETFTGLGELRECGCGDLRHAGTAEWCEECQNCWMCCECPCDDCGSADWIACECGLAEDAPGPVDRPTSALDFPGTQ